MGWSYVSIKVNGINYVEIGSMKNYINICEAEGNITKEVANEMIRVLESVNIELDNRR